jgi:hypothetical protein
MGKCPRWLEFIAVLPRVSHLISNILNYRRKVTNRGKTDVLSKPLKRRIRMGYTCMIYETKLYGIHTYLCDNYKDALYQ